MTEEQVINRLKELTIDQLLTALQHTSESKVRNQANFKEQLIDIRNIDLIKIEIKERMK